MSRRATHGAKQETGLNGKTFEKCRIIAQLGTGGMGSVWLAEHFGLGRKVRSRSFARNGRDPEYRRPLHARGTTARPHGHPTSSRSTSRLCRGPALIVMPVRRRESLSTVVGKSGRDGSRGTPRKIASGMLRGLQHAHEEGVVHLDVKARQRLMPRGTSPSCWTSASRSKRRPRWQTRRTGWSSARRTTSAPEQARRRAVAYCSAEHAAGGEVVRRADDHPVLVNLQRGLRLESRGRSPALGLVPLGDEDVCPASRRGGHALSWRAAGRGASRRRFSRRPSAPSRPDFRRPVDQRLAVDILHHDEVPALGIADVVDLRCWGAPCGRPWWPRA